MKDYKYVTVFDHPLIRHKVAFLRSEDTATKDFRELVEEITTLMTYESLKEGVITTEIEVKTPLETCTGETTSINPFGFAHNFIELYQFLRSRFPIMN